jgi:hypothetical protein
MQTLPVQQDDAEIRLEACRSRSANHWLCIVARETLVLDTDTI